VTNRDGGPPCLRSGDGTFTTTTLAATGINEIGGLCANSQYSVALELTGAAGESFVYGPGGLSTWSGQSAATPGFLRVVNVRVTFDALPGGAPDAYWSVWGVLLDGYRALDPPPGGCAAGTTFATRTPHLGTQVEGDFGTVLFAFDARGPCRGHTYGRTELTREFSIADLDRGVTLDSPPGDTLVAHVFIQTVTP
jgi:hypothetical protein